MFSTVSVSCRTGGGEHLLHCGSLMCMRCDETAAFFPPRKAKLSLTLNKEVHLEEAAVGKTNADTYTAATVVSIDIKVNQCLNRVAFCWHSN